MPVLPKEIVAPGWVCPVHGGALIKDGYHLLLCPQKHSFPVTGGIPRFVESEGYAEHYGLQWRRYRKTQLDSFTGMPITRDRMKRCLGDQLWERLPKMSVLECGCGAGRFTEVLLAQGATVTSVDLSSAVEANADLFPVSERHRVAQADILNLPFEESSYDLVFCLGVVPHTLSPEGTIRKLYSHVKPEGWIVFDHYTSGIGRWTCTKPLFRFVMKRLPADIALRFTDRLAETYLPLHRRLRNSDVGWFLLSRFSPITTYYRSIPSLPEPLQREWALLDTHDSLTDWYKRLRTAPEIQAALRELGAEEIWCEYGGNGVEARCRRPQVR
jgi:SAM-dependent methyltransferase